MGYFVSILRERVANFEDMKNAAAPTENASVMVGTQGISINDLRKNLGELNDQMAKECTSSAARYGITLDVALITAIEPPEEIESALAAINTTHNEVSSDISLAEASASQKVVQSKRAVEIETLKAQAEVQVLRQLAIQLVELKKSGGDILDAYIKNVKLSLLSRAKNMIISKHD
jgi:regulator of protease activity HflC (stomatin/prohibitin superfamily)